jgi:hypothetical protein
MADIRLTRALDNRRAAFERSEAFRPKDFSIGGKFLVSGAGEATTFVQFPIRFSQKPLITTGGEIANDAAPITRGLPIVSAVVSGWQTNRVNGRLYYTGVYLGSVVQGLGTLRVFVNWIATGRGVMNPSFAYADEDRPT